MSQSPSGRPEELRVVERFIEDASEKDYTDTDRFREEAAEASRAFEEWYNGTHADSSLRFIKETGEKLLGAMLSNMERLYPRSSAEREAVEEALTKAETTTSASVVVGAVSDAARALRRKGTPGDGDSSPTISCAKAASAVELERKLNDKLGDGEPEGISMLADDGDFYGCVLLSEAVEDLHE